MRFNNLPRITLLLSLLLFASNTRAELRGGGAITIDTESKLEWLDVYRTDGLSYGDLVSGAGGWYASGWRHANEDEVLTLWEHAGFTPGSFFGDGPMYGRITEYLRLTSHYIGDPDYGYLRLQYAYYAPEPGASVAPFAVTASTDDLWYDSSANIGSSLPHLGLRGSVAIRTGNYLVRGLTSSVPESASTGFLFAASTLLLLLYQRSGLIKAH